MLIAIISDIHDHRENFERLLTELNTQKPDYMILLGDYGAPTAITKPLLDLNIPTFAIWGNNDGEVYKTIEFFHQAPHAHIGPKTYDWLELDSKKIFLTHYHDLIQPMALSGLYDVIFYGHNHTAKIETIESTLVVNPGAVVGSSTTGASFAYWDTETMDIEFIDIG